MAARAAVLAIVETLRRQTTARRSARQVTGMTSGIKESPRCSNCGQPVQSSDETAILRVPGPIVEERRHCPNCKGVIVFTTAPIDEKQNGLPSFDQTLTTEIDFS
jgi:hypothetical protein